MFFEAFAMTVAAFCASAADVAPSAANATAAFHTAALNLVAMAFPHRVLRSARRPAAPRVGSTYGPAARIMARRSLCQITSARRLLKPHARGGLALASVP